MSHRNFRPGPSTLIALAFAAILAGALARQVLARPVVGIADNSDFGRIMSDFGLQHRSEIYHERYFDYFNRLYVVRPETATASEYRTPAKLLAGAAVRLEGWVGQGELFDIRWLGFLNGLLYWAGGTALLFSFRRRPGGEVWPDPHEAPGEGGQRGADWNGLSRQVTLSALAVLMLSDVALVQFMNSFYSEPTALIAIVWLTAGSCLLCVAGGAGTPGGWGWRLVWLGIVGLAAIILTTTKPQFAPLGLVGGLWALRLVTASDPQAETSKRANGTGRRRAITGAAVLILITGAGLFSYFGGTPVLLKEQTAYNAVFINLLGNSPDPAGDLSELGFDKPQRYLKLSGLYHWDYRVQETLQRNSEIAAQIRQVDQFDVLRLYLRHPRRLVLLLAGGARQAFNTRLEGYGNFEQAAGFRAYAQSQRFNLWSRLHQAVLSGSVAVFIIFFVASLLGGLYARLRIYRRGVGRLYPETHLFLLALALVGFLTVVFGEGLVDYNRHLIVFNLTCDLSLLFIVGYLFDQKVRKNL